MSPKFHVVLYGNVQELASGESQLVSGSDIFIKFDNSYLVWFSTNDIHYLPFQNLTNDDGIDSTMYIIWKLWHSN